jgi:hypothetical protein
LIKGDWPLAGSFACRNCLPKIFNVYERKYLKQRADARDPLSEVQKSRLELLEAARKRHCRETVKSWQKKIKREGIRAVEHEEFRLLQKRETRAGNPETLKARAKAERQRREGKKHRPFGPRRGKDTGEYDADTRKHLSTLALLCFKHSGQASIFRPSMIQLSDVLIRKRWDELPQFIKDDIGGLNEQNKDFPYIFYRTDINNWIGFFTFERRLAPKTCYIRNSVRTISNETVPILPDEEARATASRVRSSRRAALMQGGSREKPWLMVCDFLLNLLFDPSEEVELKQNAENLKWW